MPKTSRAALWMIGAIVSFTSMAIAGREVSFELDTFEIMTFRSLTGLLIVLIFARIFGTLPQISTAHLGLHAVRNLAHFTGQNLWFYALTVIPLAQVFALEFTTPIWVILLAPLLLSERITKIGLLAALVGFAGVMIVTRPGAAPSQSEHLPLRPLRSALRSPRYSPANSRAPSRSPAFYFGSQRCSYVLVWSRPDMTAMLPCLPPLRCLG